MTELNKPIGAICKPDNHIFLYSGTNINDNVPEGLLCTCEQKIAHYEKCPTCGSICLIPQDNIGEPCIYNDGSPIT